MSPFTNNVIDIPERSKTISVLIFQKCSLSAGFKSDFLKSPFSHDFIGEFFATVNSLAKDYKNATTFPCINEKKRKKKGSKYKNSGVVRHDSKSVTE